MMFDPACMKMTATSSDGTTKPLDLSDDVKAQIFRQICKIERPAPKCRQCDVCRKVICLACNEAFTQVITEDAYCIVDALYSAHRMVKCADRLFNDNMLAFDVNIFVPNVSGICVWKCKECF